MKKVVQLSFPPTGRGGARPGAGRPRGDRVTHHGRAPVDVRHPREDLCRMEGELLERINDLGIGPQGLGGRVTALAVNVEVYPTHIAGLPVAVNLGCHSTRRMSGTL